MKRAYGLASRAVLVGSTGGHESRRAVIEQRLRDLSDLLADEFRWGQHPDNCVVLVDPANSREVKAALSSAAKGVGREGLLLVYYVGPVQLGQGKALSLLLTGERDTAVPYSEIRWWVRSSRARWRVLVFDCHDVAAGADANDAEAIAGAAVDTSQACVVVHASPVATAGHPSFTAEFLDVLTGGIRRGPNMLDVQLLHQTVTERLMAAGSSPPVLKVDGQSEPVPLTRNRALYRADLVGQVLYATAAAAETAGATVGDPELAGAVVLILRYDRDTGALGVVINRPGVAQAHALAPNWAGVLGEPAVVFDGGPVQHEGYISLALLRHDAARPLRFRPVVARVGTLALSAQTDHAVERFRLFRGFLGWPPGGLEDDLARQVLVPTDEPASLAFTDNPAGLWRRLRAAT